MPRGFDAKMMLEMETIAIAMVILCNMSLIESEIIECFRYNVAHNPNPVNWSHDTCIFFARGITLGSNFSPAQLK